MKYEVTFITRHPFAKVIVELAEHETAEHILKASKQKLLAETIGDITKRYVKKDQFTYKIKSDV